jgi:hypothetical protein
MAWEDVLVQIFVYLKESNWEVSCDEDDWGIYTVLTVQILFIAERVI